MAKSKSKKLTARIESEIASIRKAEGPGKEPVWNDNDLLAPLQGLEGKGSKNAEGSKKNRLVKASFARERVTTESSDAAREFYAKSSFGTIDRGKVQLSLMEALYLLEKGKLQVMDKKKKLNAHDFISRAKKVEPNFWIRYCVFRDMRGRGYIIKTALKFGADFRVYDRGIKPGQDHARWIIFPVKESDTLTWYEFAARNRVAHSTKKRLLMGLVDDEGDVSYFEIKWMRP